jgi:serine phosphatase RsbU (regulator of sigma subunit)/streptogramin lyase
VTSINTNQVQSFYEDSVGNVWIGTVDGGLNFWERNFNTFVHYAEVPDDSTSLNNMHVTSILRDSENKIFIGTDGGGLNIFEESKGRFVHVLNTLRTPNAIPGNEIRKIIEDKQGFIWIGTFDGGLCRYNRTIHKMTFFRHNSEQQSSIGSNKVTDVLEDNEGNIWVGTYDAGISKLKKGRNSFTHFRSDLHNKHAICDNRIHAIFNDRQGRIWIGTGNGLAKYNPKTDDFTCYNDENGLRSNAIVGITQDKNNNIWLGTVNGLIRFNPTTTSSKNYDVRDGLQSNEFLARSAFACKDGMLLFGGVNGFNSFYPDKLKENLIVPKIAITNFLVNNAAFQTDTNISIVKRIVLQHDQNTFSFNFAAFSYVFSEKNQYAFKMEGLDKDWNYVKNMRYAQYSKLSPDKYVFRVKGSNNDGHWNEQGVAIEIIIKPAFWQTMWFKFLIALLAGLGIYAGFRYRLQRIEAQKIHLEELVTLRTKEIELQKEEIETQRDEIQSKSDEIIAQRDDMEQQRDQISVKNREIRSSIVYAERIQRATLPEQHTIPNSLADFFVFFQPKDIVSGDFYWVGEQKGWVILVAADCTGHGVPGAFMSMLGTSFLNKIVNEKGHTHPSQILNKLRQNVIDALHQRGEINEARDGMDIAICSYNPSKRVIQFSGANNPLYRVRDGESEIFKGDKMPIAIYEEMHPFTQIELQVQPGDAFYIFSDGYADQFGGTFNKKFKYKPFRELLTIHAHRPMLEQKQVLIDTFEDWRGVNEQVDDIIVMGFTI